jgi:hypothetical protein
MFNLSLDRRGRQGDALGEIQIEEFRQEFLVDLSHWNVQQYWASWRRSAAHLLEHGYGRFACSVDAPGGLYDTWGCWVKDGRVALFRSVLLPSITAAYARAEEAETPASDYAERGMIEPGIDYHWCALADIADFERRLHGERPQ